MGKCRYLGDVEEDAGAKTRSAAMIPKKGDQHILRTYHMASNKQCSSSRIVIEHVLFVRLEESIMLVEQHCLGC